MMGSNRRAETMDAITGAVRSAGGLVTAALAIACAALVVAAVALIVAVKRPGMVAHLGSA